MALASSIAEIDARSLTPRDFHAGWVHSGRPVRIKGLASSWAAAKWTFPDLSRQLCASTVKLRSSYSEGGQSLEAQSVLVTEMEDQLRERDGPGPNWVLDVLGDAPELRAQFPTTWCEGEVKELSLLLGRNTVSNHHYHPFRQSLLCQLNGTKRLVLHPPTDSRNLYPRSFVSGWDFHVSQANAAAVDFERFPRMRDAHPVEAILPPGDGIFIPVGWWHAVFGSGPVMSIRFTWRARLRELPFPQPSLRNLAATLYWHARHLARHRWLERT